MSMSFGFMCHTYRLPLLSRSSPLSRVSHDTLSNHHFKQHEILCYLQRASFSKHHDEPESLLSCTNTVAYRCGRGSSFSDSPVYVDIVQALRSQPESGRMY